MLVGDSGPFDMNMIITCSYFIYICIKYQHFKYLKCLRIYLIMNDNKGVYKLIFPRVLLILF